MGKILQSHFKSCITLSFLHSSYCWPWLWEEGKSMRLLVPEVLDEAEFIVPGEIQQLWRTMPQHLCAQALYWALLCKISQKPHECTMKQIFSFAYRDLERLTTHRKPVLRDRRIKIGSIMSGSKASHFLHCHVSLLTTTTPPPPWHSSLLQMPKVLVGSGSKHYCVHAWIKVSIPESNENSTQTGLWIKGKLFMDIWVPCRIVKWLKGCGRGRHKKHPKRRHLNAIRAAVLSPRAASCSLVSALVFFTANRTTDSSPPQAPRFPMGQHVTKSQIQNCQEEP